MSTPPKPIRAPKPRNHSIARSPFSSSYINASPIAQASIARDLADCSDEDVEAEVEDEDAISSDEDEESETSTVRHEDGTNPQHSMASSYRRPSFVAYGGTRPTITPKLNNTNYLTKKEKKQVRDEERSLLRDNNLRPPKHSGRADDKQNVLVQTYKKLFSTKRPVEETRRTPSNGGIDEATALLGATAPLESVRSRGERLNRQWEAAVKAGKIKTTWQRESKVLIQYSSPLVVTFLLQYSLTVASIFTIGHIGKVELGAVSLASMTANISGYAIYQGLATSLDTLCAQAYGSGKKHLVGLQLQRMVYFLWAITIPVGIFWFFAEPLIAMIVPERRSAELAGLYLRVLLIGAPGYAAFESGKRFVQAQGMFSATTYCLLIAAPFNAFLNWLFVWHFGWGFVGAPIAVAITDNLLPILLFLYVRFVDGKQCWNGFTWKAFHNWGPMVKLALPGLLMVEAEFLAFEILTLAASWLDTTHLAAQSVVSTITAITFQIPFPISIAASTRVANLIGATLTDAAKMSAKVSFVVSAAVGTFNIILLLSCRNYIPQLFTSDPDVIVLVARVIPVCAAFQLFDAVAANCNGLLRGLGFQEVGGWTNLFCYYIVAMPISFGTAFGLDWKLEGLWTGVAIALGLVALIEGYFLWRTDWEQAVRDAEGRNSAA